MSLQVEKLEHNMAKLTIEVAAEEVEKAIQAAYLKQRGKISLPGFRKGRYRARCWKRCTERRSFTRTLSTV